jgi:hypothetical protein
MLPSSFSPAVFERSPAASGSVPGGHLKALPRKAESALARLLYQKFLPAVNRCGLRSAV